MNDREKLIELLNEGYLTAIQRNLSVMETQVRILLANGVTVQRWIPVTERLPEPFEDVLVFRDGEISIDYHEENGWFAYDFKGKRVSHWMPLPEPPKGE